MKDVYGLGWKDGAEADNSLVLRRQENEFARFLLRLGYGINFSSSEAMPEVRILEAMVRIAAHDREFDWVVDQEASDAEEQAHFVISSEIGEWRR